MKRKKRGKDGRGEGKRKREERRGRKLELPQVSRKKPYK